MKEKTLIFITVAVISVAFLVAVSTGLYTVRYIKDWKSKEEVIREETKKAEEEAKKTEYVYTDEESLDYVSRLYGEAELIDSVYVTEPEPKRTCTFRDVKHGFEYTLTSYKGYNDLFFPSYGTALDSDYREKLTADLEENIKPVLENEGIVLFYDEDPEEYVENRITAYSYRQDTIVTPYSLLDECDRKIELAIYNYDSSLVEYAHNARFFDDYLRDDEEIEDNAEEIEDNEDTISYPTAVEDLGIDPTELGGGCAPIED
ncbi:MAG: hypothetical protein IKZ76_04850 [Lachnospiraceae bacterium]|nr:hypothetical protein [Lachnospiraceae bacterium]MBR5917396.1 hypothetical protein [Lachnospiraceae bacterium]